MKKTLLFMTAALIGLAACQNEVSPVEKPSGDDAQIKDYPYEISFTALNERSVKTMLDVSRILWEDNDEIKIFWEQENPTRQSEQQVKTRHLQHSTLKLRKQKATMQYIRILRLNA